MRYVDDTPDGSQLEFDSKTHELKIYDDEGEVVYTFTKDSTLFLKLYLNQVIKD